MKHKIEPGIDQIAYEESALGDWIASLIVWFIVVAMVLAILCVLFGPAE